MPGSPAWASTCSTPRTRSLKASGSPDVIVVGAGIAGASAAHELKLRGASVMLLDRGEVSGGTTGLGEGNVLVSDKPPGPERDLAVLGRDRWVELGEQFPEARVTRKGALLLWEGMGPAGPDPRTHEPELAPGLDAMLDPDELQVDPRGLTLALARPVLTVPGAEVRVVAADRVEVKGGTFRAGAVVVAAGPWSGPLTGLPVEPRKGQLVALRADGVTLNHKLIAASYLDAVEAASDDLVIAPVIEQTLDGDRILVGSSRERVGFDPVVRPEVTRAMIAAAARYVPAVERLEVVDAWCGFRPWLPDGLPAIGQLESGVWTTTGHEGAGVGLGPISGRLLAQMIVGEEPLMDPSPFDPKRFG